MRRMVAYDARRGRKVSLCFDGSRLLVERFSGRGEARHVLMDSHHDSHTHPVMYSLLFGALDPVMLNESTDREEILGKLRQRAKESDAPIFAYEYKNNAGITADDLDEFKRHVWLVDSSLHGGVASNSLLEEVRKRGAGCRFGGISKKGISEDFNFVAMGVMEESVYGKGVAAVVSWVKARITEGTTSFDEKVIFTKAGWEIFKAAIMQLKGELGYNPAKSVYIHHNLFVSDPARFAQEAEALGVDIGVKWVGDGGLGSKTAALKVWSYTDGSRGELTMPLDTNDPKAMARYLGLLRDAGMGRLACHAIGNRTIGIVLDMAGRFAEAGIALSIEHFELPTEGQIARAAELGLPLNMQLNYSTEVWRYEPWVGQNVRSINPVRKILNAYNSRGFGDSITFGTDGMPQSMLWAIACGVQHPLEHERISVQAAMMHSRDPEGLMVVTKETYDMLLDMDLEKASMNREASAAKLHEGIVLVARDSRVLHSTL